MIAVGYIDPYKHVLGFVSCLADAAGDFGEYSGSSRRHYATNIAGRRLPPCSKTARCCGGCL